MREILKSIQSGPLVRINLGNNSIYTEQMVNFERAWRRETNQIHKHTSNSYQFLFIMVQVVSVLIIDVGDVVSPNNAVNSKFTFLVQILIFVAATENITF